MTEGRLSLEKCTDLAHWNSFVAGSPQGSVFCSTDFLNGMGLDYDLWFVFRDSQLQAGVAVLRHGDRILQAPLPLMLYHGVLFDAAIARMPLHRRVDRCLSLTEYLIGEMEALYDRISLCLHPAFEDLRPFQWFHYHEPQRGQFKIDLFYTGVIDLSSDPGFEQYLSEIRRVRRAEYRRGRSRGLVVEPSQDIESLVRLHEVTFDRQGLALGEGDAQAIRAIVQAGLDGGFGELLVCRDEEGETVSAQFYAFDADTGYILIGGHDPAHRGAGGGTASSGIYMALENIRRCAEMGLTRVDFCGINSPNRGAYKTSLNAGPTPYFVLDWERPADVA